MNDIVLPKLPHSPGVYLMRDASGKIIYIGKARDLKKRVASYFTPSKRGANYAEDNKMRALLSAVRHVDYFVAQSEREALILERRLISDHQPELNVMWRDDKSYPYIALTMGEDFPRLILTRNKKRDGTRYFGPYPNVRSVRQLLKWVWRKKLFPLRPCKYEFDEKHLLTYNKVRSCLYLHTKECSAPCIGKISSRDYKRIAERARLFFEGRYGDMARRWGKEMKTLSRAMKYEEAAGVRDRLNTVQHMQERVTFTALTPEMLDRRLNESRAVQDLMRQLKLPTSPERIECFDISHIQGLEKVASMVSFYRGRPDKSNYRKFIIRSVEGIDDFKSMAEVVGRRYGRLLSENKSLPELVLVDGGKGQLSAAVAALEKLKCKNLPIAALAKREEEIFLPASSDPVRLPADSPALLLLRHVRDEAHRFAITFHRQRRGKRFLKGGAS